MTLSWRAFKSGVSDSAKSRSMAQGAAESVAPMNWGQLLHGRSESKAWMEGSGEKSYTRAQEDRNKVRPKTRAEREETIPDFGESRETTLNHNEQSRLSASKR